MDVFGDDIRLAKHIAILIEKPANLRPRSKRHNFVSASVCETRSWRAWLRFIFDTG